MPRKATKPILVPPSPAEIPDDITAIKPYPEGGFGDTCKIVVPIRDDLQQIILAKLEDDLKWNQAIIDNPNANDSPSWTGRVKKASLSVEAIKAKIVKIKQEMKEA